MIEFECTWLTSSSPGYPIFLSTVPPNTFIIFTFIALFNRKTSLHSGMDVSSKAPTVAEGIVITSRLFTEVFF